MFSGGIPAQLSSDASLGDPATADNKNPVTSRRARLRLGSFRICHNGAASSRDPQSAASFCVRVCVRERVCGRSHPPLSNTTALPVLPARPTNTYWTDSIRIQGGEVPPTAGPDWPASRRRASASPRHWTAPRVRLHRRAPTDRSNGRRWEMMLLLCFQRGLRHYLHPCTLHAPPCCVRRAAAPGGGAAQECVVTFRRFVKKKQIKNKKHLFPVKGPLLM